MPLYNEILEALQRARNHTLETPLAETAALLVREALRMHDGGICVLDDAESAEHALNQNGGWLIVEPWGMIVSDDTAMLANLIAHRFGGDQEKAEAYLTREMEAFGWNELNKPSKE